jgi:hypothetical protein
VVPSNPVGLDDPEVLASRHVRSHVLHVSRAARARIYGPHSVELVAGTLCIIKFQQGRKGWDIEHLGGWRCAVS